MSCLKAPGRPRSFEKLGPQARSGKVVVFYSLACLAENRADSLCLDAVLRGPSHYHIDQLTLLVVHPFIGIQAPLRKRATTSLCFLTLVV